MFSSNKFTPGLEPGEQKKLRSMSKVELLEQLAQQTKRAERLQRELDEVRHQLQARKVEIEKMGSLAEASLKLNGVFDAAQQAADTYLENVQRITGLQVEKLSEREAETERQCQEREAQMEERCRLLEEEAAERCNSLEEEAAERCRLLEEEATAHCKQMEESARRKCEKYLSELQSRLQSQLMDFQTDLEFTDDDGK